MNKIQKDIVSQLITEAEKYGNGIIEGNSKKANKAETNFRKLIELTETDSRKSLLEPLCENENIAVKICAAAYLLPINQEYALSILTECTNDNSVLGLMAEATLDMWKNGQLKL